MPILPRAVESRVRRRDPDIKGEEGFLYHEPGRGSWIKRWNIAHETGFGVPDRYQESSVLSPYWAKRIYFEAKTAHLLLPDLTLEPQAAYDPRLHTTNLENGYGFTLMGGKPVTVSREVDTSDPLAREYSTIIHNLYQNSAPLFDEIRNGEEVNPETRTNYDNMFDSADQRLAALLRAPEFLLFSTDSVSNFYSVEDVEAFYARLEKKVRSVNPKSPILPLLEAGILPGHPLLNFIPKTDPHSPYQPAGRFIEFAIQAYPRTRKKITDLHDTALEKRANHNLDNFLLNRALDQLFISILRYVLSDREASQFINSEELQNALYLLLEKIRSNVQKRRVNPDDYDAEIFKMLRPSIQCIINCSKLQKALKRLRALRESIK